MSPQKQPSKAHLQNFVPTAPREPIEHCPTCNRINGCRICGLQRPDCRTFHANEHEYTPLFTL